MAIWIDGVMVALILINLMLVGSSRLSACIRIVALQGIILGMLPLQLYDNPLAAHVLLIAVGSLVLKGGVFPWLLSRALREANVRREMEPFVGYTLSLLIGIVSLAASLWMSTRLPLPVKTVSSLVVPVALFTIVTGLFLIVNRKKALSQVMGYLVMENGIYTFGVALARQEPLLVELGVLLDVFVAVFVMGITIFHINREFDHIDTDRLTTLKDWST